MRVLPMADAVPGRGQVFCWRITDSTAASITEARIDDRPVSFLQQNHARGLLTQQANPDARPHRGYIGSATDVPDELDTNILTSALTQFVGRHEELRSWLEVGDNGLMRRRVMDADSVSFRCEKGPFIQSRAQMRSYLDDVFAEAALCTHWPGFAFLAVEQDDGFAMVAGCDHGISDGMSQAMFLIEIYELYRIATRGDAPAITANKPGSFADYATEEAARVASLDPGDADLGEWIGIFERNGSTMPRSTVDLGLAPGETAPVKPLLVPLLEGTDLRDFDAACTAAGGRVITGFFAALGICDYEVAGRDNYYGITVRNTRGTGSYLLSQGWFCNFTPIAFDVAGAASFRQLVLAAVAGYDRSRRLAEVPIESVLTTLLTTGRAGPDATASPNLVTYIDFRQGPADEDPAYQNGRMFTGEGRTANASLWVIRDENSLYVGSQTPDTEFAQSALANYHHRLEEVLTTVARTGDYSITAPTVLIGAPRPRKV